MLFHMMSPQRFFFLFVNLWLVNQLQSQVYSLDDDLDGQGILTCSGTFYDSGGPFGNYQPDEDYTVTFCSDNGDPIQFDFVLETEPVFDELSVFDGPTTSSPELAGSPFAGDQVFTVTSSGLCLTFQFTTGSIVELAGWEATISCVGAVVCPTINITPPGDVCTGETTGLDIQMTGSGPWIIEYSIDGIPQAPFNSATPINTIPGLPPGTISLTSLTDAECSVVLDEEVIINEIIGPSVDWLDDEIELCEGVPATTPLDIIGSGGTPWTLTYTLDGVAQPDLVVPFIPFDFPVSTGGTYAITSITDGNCTTVLDPPPVLDAIETLAPDITISGDASICPGGSVDLEVNLGTTDAFTFDYLLDGVPLDTLDVIGPTAQITVDQVGTYTLGFVTSNGCDGTVSGTANVTLSTPPTIGITGPTELCAGNTGTLDISLTGQAPYTIEFSVNGVPQPPLVSFTDDIQITDVPVGTVTIDQLTDDNCSIDPDVEFVIAEVDAPTLSIVGDYVPLCPGQTTDIIMELEGTGPWLVSYSFDAFPLPDLLIAQSPFTFVNAPPGVYEFFNLSDQTCNVAIDITLDLGPAPTPSASLDGVVNLCPGGTAGILVAFNGPGEFTADYLLDGVLQGSLVLEGPDGLFEVSSAGTYTLDNISDGNCPGESIGSVFVQSVDGPTAQFSGGTDICPDGSGNLEVILTGNGPWSFDYAIDGIEQSEVLTDSSPFLLDIQQTGDYQLLTVTDLDCETPASDLASVGLLPTPAAVVSGQTIICPGDEGELSLELTGQGPFQVQWALNGLPFINTTSSGDTTIFVSSAGEYTLTQVSDALCSGTVEGGATVSLQPPILLEVTSDTTICLGSSISLNGAASGGIGPPYSVFWSFDSDTVPSNNLLITPSSSTIYTFNATDGCDFIYNEEVVVDVQDLQTPALLSESNIQCSIETISLDTDVPLSTIAETCLWTIDGVTYSACEALELQLDSTGLYDVSLELISAIGCTADSIYSDAVEVSANPIAAFAFQPSLADNIQDELVFQDSSFMATSYSWLVDGVEFSIDAEPNLILSSEEGSKIFQVCQAVANDVGCVDTVCVDIPFIQQFIIHVPQAFTPDGDDINEAFAPTISGPPIAEYVFTIHDRTGREIWSTIDPSERWNARGAFSEGYYAGDSIYQWTLEIRATNSVEKQRLTGFVTLLR